MNSSISPIGAVGAIGGAGNVGSFVPMERIQLQSAADAAARRAETLQRESDRVRQEAEVDMKRADKLRKESHQADEESNSIRSQAQRVPSAQQVGAAHEAVQARPLNLAAVGNNVSVHA